MSKKKFKNIITILLIVIIVFWLTVIDWDHFFSKNNSGALLGILAPILIIISLQIKNKENNNS